MAQTGLGRGGEDVAWFPAFLIIRDLLKANTWIWCDGVLATLSDRGWQQSPAPGEAQLCCFALPQLHFGSSWGMCM